MLQNCRYIVLNKFNFKESKNKSYGVRASDKVVDFGFNLFESLSVHMLHNIQVREIGDLPGLRAQALPIAA